MTCFTASNAVPFCGSTFCCQSLQFAFVLHLHSNVIVCEYVHYIGEFHCYYRKTDQEHQEDSLGQYNGWSLIILTSRYGLQLLCLSWSKRDIEFSLILIDWLIQDIKEKRDEDLLVLPTDAVLFEDPSFKVKEKHVLL